MDGDLDVSHNNTKGSRSQEKQDIASRDSESSSEVSEDPAPATENAAAGKDEFASEEPVEQEEILSTEEVTWDIETNKFSRAREGQSELAPLAVIEDPIGNVANQTGTQIISGDIHIHRSVYDYGSWPRKQTNADLSLQRRIRFT
jgi:hypothetical protein